MLSDKRRKTSDECDFIKRIRKACSSKRITVPRAWYRSTRGGSDTPYPSSSGASFGFHIFLLESPNGVKPTITRACSFSLKHLFHNLQYTHRPLILTVTTPPHHHQRNIPIKLYFAPRCTKRSTAAWNIQENDTDYKQEAGQYLYVSIQASISQTYRSARFG